MVVTWALICAAVLYGLRRRRRDRPHLRTPSARARRRGMLVVSAIMGIQLVVLSPTAFAAECVEPPIPERPGAGMVGAIDPPALDHGDAVAKTNYWKYGYAGTVWNVYDDNCVLSKNITDPNAAIDTWAGNQLFNVGKNIVGATNGLHYAMLSQESMLAPLDNAVENAAKTFYDNIYVQAFTVVALVLAVLLFRQIWSGDLAAIGRRGLWALAGIWVAASVLSLGPVYSQLDSQVLERTSQIQGGFLAEDTPDRHALPESLYNNVVWDNWRRGEFGDPDSETARRYGPELLAAQAWTKGTLPSADDEAKIKEKQDQFRAMPGKLGSSAGFFKGTDGSRIGAGFLGMLQGFAYSLFPLFAKAAVLLAQVLLRVLLLGAPLLGLAAMLLNSLLPKVARVAGAVLLSVLMLSALAGMHALLLQLIFGAGSRLSLLAQVLLASLITVLFLMIGRPIRRMKQMVELSVGSLGSGSTAAGNGGVFNVFRRRRGTDTDTPQDRFWSGVRDTDIDPPRPEESLGGGRRRVRPEASGAVSATAQRLDGRGQLAAARGEQGNPAVGFNPLGGGRPGVNAALPPANQARQYQANAAPGGQRYSRVVDAPPVVDASSWDRADDSVVVPSRVNAPMNEGRADQSTAAPPPRPLRRAETEMIGGRPVFVLYRPSRGFEVRDNETWDNGRSPVR